MCDRSRPQLRRSSREETPLSATLARPLFERERGFAMCSYNVLLQRSSPADNFAAVARPRLSDLVSISARHPDSLCVFFAGGLDVPSSPTLSPLINPKNSL